MTAEEQAALWQLSLEQWQRYESYMAQTGKYFYKHLDPVFVAGLIAENDRERREIAELYAQQEYDRTRRLIAFQDDFTRAMKKLHGDEPLVSLAKLENLLGDFSRRAKREGKPKPSDRVTLFITDGECADCDSAFKTHYKRLGGRYPPGLVLDLYFVGTKDNGAIQAWARRMEIDPAMVRAGTITLNHDDDRYPRFGSPELPAAFLMREGKVVGRL